MSEDKQKEYNDDPIWYCTNCLNITIKRLKDTQYDYCGSCGCTDLSAAHVYEWEEKYIEFYGERYLKADKKIDG